MLVGTGLSMTSHGLEVQIGDGYGAVMFREAGLCTSGPDASEQSVCMCASTEMFVRERER